MLRRLIFVVMVIVVITPVGINAASAAGRQTASCPQLYSSTRPVSSTRFGTVRVVPSKKYQGEATVVWRLKAPFIAQSLKVKTEQYGTFIIGNLRSADKGGGVKLGDPGTHHPLKIDAVYVCLKTT